MGAFSVAEQARGAVVDLATPAFSEELAEVESRLHVLRGLLDARGHLDEINRAVQFVGDKRSALKLLQQPPFGYSCQQARAILEMPMSWQTSDEGERLRQERDRLTRRRATLQERAADLLALHWFG